MFAVLSIVLKSLEATTRIDSSNATETVRGNIWEASPRGVLL